MPLGIVSDDSFLEELNKLGNESSDNNEEVPLLNEEGIPRAIVHVPSSPGRGDSTNVPESLRKIISEEAIEGTSAKELSQLFGVSTHSVGAYKNGATSLATYNKPNPELKKHTMMVKDRIVKRANKKLMQALDEITAEKLSDTKARDLAGIAKDMSAVIRNLTPESEQDSKAPPVQFVLFAPQIRKEEHYDIIEVQE